MSSTSPNKPTHDLCIITGEGRAAIWTRVAALWPTKDDGLSGELPKNIMVSGRVVIHKRKTGDTEDAA